MSNGLGGLAHLLVSHGLLTAESMTKALSESQQQQISIIPYLVDNKLAPANQIARLLSQEFGDPLFDLNALDVDVIPKDLVDEKIVNRYGALPLFRRGQKLFVGLSDPTRLDAIDAIAFNAKLSVETVVVEEDKLKKMIERAYTSSGSLGDFGNVDLSADIDDHDKDDDATDVNEAGGEDAPVVKFVNKMLLDAIRMGASDLHFEPYEKTYRVRFRVDGVMQVVSRPPVQLAGKIAARLKVMSQMDISERRTPPRWSYQT